MAKRKKDGQTLQGREILVGVTGGIAAYKTADLVSLLAQEGAAVSVVMTEHATRFVGPLTFQALSRRPVYTDLFAEGAYDTDHIALADRAEAAVVAPATANVIGKLAAGIADDLLSTVLVALRVPVILAPAMNEAMWNHPAVQANVETLRRRGVRFVGPEEGRLACGTEGLGRMAEPETILDAVIQTLSSEHTRRG
ncbi:MAG: bifunctional phosphopantothenoylcysteine decarboxylase/phosphopantothenate--cysteine ligase CoaBC [Phycisphaerae bacterium]